ncbi:MAG TPA: FHA domain-containing protein, partial [Acidimicrobiia bacterium]|nr:FHA domain-containing protein [Acidimicrobiia bacterium]
TIGRQGADISLEDDEASRQHSAIEILGDHAILRDLGSTNGTYVNGERLDEIDLEPGDEVFIGRFHFTVARS